MSLVDRHCTFCDLIHGAGEVSICYEDADAIAFMDIQPVNPGHVLVVPRRHYETFEEVPAELAMHLFRVASTLVPAIKLAANAEGMNIVVFRDGVEELIELSYDGEHRPPLAVLHELVGKRMLPSSD